MKFLTDEAREEFTRKVQCNKGKLPKIEVILKLIAKGYTQTEVGKNYGVSRQSVNKVLLKHARTSLTHI